MHSPHTHATYESPGGSIAHATALFTFYVRASVTHCKLTHSSTDS